MFRSPCIVVSLGRQVISCSSCILLTFVSFVSLPATSARIEQPWYECWWIDSVLCSLPPFLRNEVLFSQNLLPPVPKGLVQCCVWLVGPFYSVLWDPWLVTRHIYAWCSLVQRREYFNAANRGESNDKLLRLINHECCVTENHAVSLSWRRVEGLRKRRLWFRIYLQRADLWITKTMRQIYDCVRSRKKAWII